MLTLRDDSGDSLQGNVDALNATFRTQLPMRMDRPVDVYVNGQCLFPALDNGYILKDAQTVVLKEIPLLGDTVSIRYCATPVVVGVPGSQVQDLSAVTVEAGDLLLSATTLEPTDTLKATINCCGC